MIGLHSEINTNIVISKILENGVKILIAELIISMTKINAWFIGCLFFK